MRLTLLFTLLLPALAAAQTGQEPTGFAFLRLEPSARASALGGAYGAVPGDDPNVLFYNPALPGEAMHKGIALSYLNLLAGINAGFLTYARHLDAIGTVTAGLRFFDYGDFDAADASGMKSGTFGAQDAALTVGLARNYTERLHYGASVSFIHSGIEEVSSQAIAFDAGAAFSIPEEQLTLSASVHNVGTVLNAFDAVKEDLPLDVRFSVSKRLQYLPLLLTMTGYNLHSYENPRDLPVFGAVMEHVALGGEFQFSEAFQVRVGYSHRQHEELKSGSRLDLAGVRLGFGLKVRGFGLDYGFSSWSSFGSLHQFTLRTVL